MYTRQITYGRRGLGNSCSGALPGTCTDTSTTVAVLPGQTTATFNANPTLPHAVSATAAAAAAGGANTNKTSWIESESLVSGIKNGYIAGGAGLLVLLALVARRR